MTRFCLAFFGAFLLASLFFHCTRGPATADDLEVPWATATYLDPVTTKLTFRNDTDTNLYFNASVRNYPTELDRIASDSLAPGETLTVKVDIHRPQHLFVQLGEVRTMRTLLPGYARELGYSGGSITETGPERETYTYLDAVLEPLTPAGRVAPEITSTVVYGEELRRDFTAHYDSIPKPELPAWVDQMARREMEMMSWQDPLQIRAFRKFFFKDTLEVPASFVDSVQLALRQTDAYQTPSFTDLHYSLSRYLGEAAAQPDAPAATQSAEAMAAAFAGDFPVSDRRYDVVANYLNQQIADQRLYGGKVEHIENLTALLPPAYQEKIGKFTDAIVARNSSTEGAQKFMDSPFETAVGTTVSPRAVRRQPTTLYKFWFAGCYPCLVQQPAERELLAKFPELEIVYVAFHTPKEEWLPYLEKHDPPATANLYVPEDQDELMRGVMGQLSAPNYLLVDHEDKIHCRKCPKPSDPLLSTMLEELTTAATAAGRDR